MHVTFLVSFSRSEAVTGVSCCRLSDSSTLAPILRSPLRSPSGTNPRRSLGEVSVSAVSCSLDPVLEKWPLPGLHFSCSAELSAHSSFRSFSD